MTPALPPADEALFARLLDGGLDPRELDALLARLRADPQARATLRLHLRTADLLSRRFDPSRHDDAFLQAVQYRLANTLDEQAETFTRRLHHQLPTRSPSWWPRLLPHPVWLAAALALGAALFPLIRPDPSIGSGPRLTLLHQDRPLSSLLPATTLSPGRPLRLTQGLARLDFPNGAVVSVQAPAAFQVRDAHTLELRHGRLSAYCPDSAHGFRVLTPTADLVDRGTSFGVDATQPGLSRVVVFQGEVDLASRSHPGESVRLVTGEASAVFRQQAPQTEAFEPRAYAQLWPLTSGIVATTGAIRPPPPDIPVRTMAYEDDSTLLVIPEKRGVRFATPFNTNPLPANGVLTTTYDQPWEVCDTRQPLRSYLCYYNPVGRPRFSGYRHFEGSITFDAPILAVIYGPSELDHSDPWFQLTPLSFPPNMRGLEDNEGEAPPDSITLSPDRRTVTLSLHTGPLTDQVRIIVADEPAPGFSALQP